MRVAGGARREKSGGGRDEWLRLAAATAGADIAAAAKAEIADAGGRDGEAFHILGEAGAPRGSPLLAKMYLRLARRREQWPQALAAAYRLRDDGRARKWEEAASDIAAAALKNIGDSAALRSFWKNNIAAEDQKKPPLLAEYIGALHRLGDEDALAEALERAVKTAARSPVILSAVAAMGSEKICETAFAAAQKSGDDKNNPEYLRAAAMLAGAPETLGAGAAVLSNGAVAAPRPAQHSRAGIAGNPNALRR